ncbi:hypothetical protein KSP39_PZI019830 [Platanthera zijinensis]|uniref:Prolyl endopeptidase n=1 Tax=Platanthera zijinensis TaxID=2320716 RepID=A0AAP0B1S3_9ASPA
MEMFGDVRVDDYYWLRDDSHSNPEILSYLKAENDYTNQSMSSVKQFEDQLYAEMVARTKEEVGISVPIRRGSYYYYERTLVGKDYKLHCRRLITNDTCSPSVYDVMPTGPEASAEHVILDENIKAQGHEHYYLGAFRPSPNNKLIAYAEDTKGDGIYTVYVIDADKGTAIGNPLKRVSVEIQDFQLFSGYVAICEKENALQKVTVYSLPQMGEEIGPLQNGRAIDFVDPIYSVSTEESQFSSNILRFSYSSMKTPISIYDYDMTLGISVLKKIQQIPGGFESSDYLTERKWAVSTDGTRVPISILYKKNLVKLDGFDPLWQHGYGSYGASLSPRFDPSVFSLVDRGFIYAIAHIRGGGEMGRKWHEDGMLLNKRNTFTDFIACAEYLIENKYGSKEKLCITGGGLLIGAVLNMRPDLFKAAVLDYPFVDVVTSLLDPTIPSTTAQREELGDPRKEEYYYYIKSYSPVDNVRAQNYPNILVNSDFYEAYILYSDAAKFVAKLRATKTDDNMILFNCKLTERHYSKTERDEYLNDTAFSYAFIMKMLDLAPHVSS